MHSTETYYIYWILKRSREGKNEIGGGNEKRRRLLSCQATSKRASKSGIFCRFTLNLPTRLETFLFPIAHKLA